MCPKLREQKPTGMVCYYKTAHKHKNALEDTGMNEHVVVFNTFGSTQETKKTVFFIYFFKKKAPFGKTKNKRWPMFILRVLGLLPNLARVCWGS